MIRPQQSLPLQSVITVNMIRKQMHDNDSFLAPPSNSSSLVVNLTDPLSSILEMIGVTNSQVKLIYNNQVLCPALSFAFYNINNNDTIVIAEAPESIKMSSSKLYPIEISTQDHENGNHLIANNPKKINLNRKLPLCRFSSAHVLQGGQRSDINISLNKENERLNNFINEKRRIEGSTQNLQRFQDSLNPMTASESARLTDIYRSRIESNTKSFRKLCAKYYALTNSDSSFSLSKKMTSPKQSSPLVRKQRTEDLTEVVNKKFKNISPSMETVLPEKPSLPSTDFLPTFTSVNRF
ncbi:hypothetical protein M9Y10_029126 [Tritrichomonas musculus]|uniref:Ubiquitin-like domain-containing protein n=1 Tax=Tritrichomonas musculus TaxID=1915356 RepID=A0ABR2KLC7_9EUKA